MDLAVVVEQVHQVAAVRCDDGAGRADLESALRGVGQLEAWLAGAKAALTSRLAGQVSFPEKTLAECTRGSARGASRDKARADTLDAVPVLAAALDGARLTAGHVDEVTRAAKSLDAGKRGELFAQFSRGLVDVAEAATVEQWRRRLALEVRRLLNDHGEARLDRQQRATSLRTWTDDDGMWCLSGRFDPVTGVTLAARVDAAVQALFAEPTPSTCPADPIDKQRHLAALALARLISGAAVSQPGPRPEVVVVVDSSQSDGVGGPQVDWGIPVEIPPRVLADLVANSDVHAIVVRNGVVLHAPGRLDLGRSTRLANRAQRRALRAMYATCAVPGCGVHYNRCKLHHVVWWRHGGRTDLDNLIPVCAQHHTQIHADDWQIQLGPERQLTIRLPDGQILGTGPPRRIAA